MILAVAFVALGAVVAVCVVALKGLGRVVSAEDADQVLRSEYDAFDAGEKR